MGTGLEELENNLAAEEANEDMVIHQDSGHRFYVDGYLKHNMDALKHSVIKRDYDGFLIVSGREGFGKSTLAAQIARYLDPTYTIERCCFTAEQFVDAVLNAKKYQAIVFDETMGYLSARGAMSEFNRSLIKIFSEMRSKNLFIILCIPNFFELDRYPAMHRSIGLIYVYKRTLFASYDYSQKKKLYIQGKKFYSYIVPPTYRGKFVKYFLYNKEEYEKKKSEGIAEYYLKKKAKGKNAEKKLNLLINYLLRKGETIENIAKILDVKPESLENEDIITE